MKHYLNLFDDFERDFFRTSAPAMKSWKPASFIDEQENHYHLALDIPGVDREHLKVNLDNNVLSIAGERRDKRALKDESSESFFKFESKYSLPDNINQDEVEVSLHNGVLDILIPKFQKQNTSRSIEIKSGPSKLS